MPTTDNDCEVSFTPISRETKRKRLIKLLALQKLLITTAEAVEVEIAWLDMPAQKSCHRRTRYLINQIKNTF